MTTRIISTTGVAVVVHDGKEYRPNRKGYFYVPDEIVSALRAHGFELAADPYCTGLAGREG
ncbi:MAG TPA: hypothetical protein VK558_17180 [Patescibacteria group bacterium]|nr:hypothetical protein [Patescibacteria group bacterium]